MSRGRKSTSTNLSSNWQNIFWKSLPTYIGILNGYFKNIGNDLVEVGECIEKLSFTIPKGLNSKEIESSGKYPVISQSKEYIIGYSGKENLLITNDLPIVVFGDHSKTIKYVDKPFIIGADGVKLIKPKSCFNEKFFFFFLHGVITDTKDYGRHFSLLRKGYIAKVANIDLQKSVIAFLEDLNENSISKERKYFNEDIENKIIEIQESQFKGSVLSSELINQLTLVKKLHQQLLQDAVQGKLVEQSAKDEPASELLKRIKAEKTKLIKEGKLKKEKELPPIKSEEIPFKIPENWVWCRLGEICTKIGSGSTPNGSNYAVQGIPFFRSQNIYESGLVYDDIKFISDEIHKQMNGTVVYSNDILLNITGGSLGRSVLVPNDLLEGNVSQHVCIIRPICIENMFLHNVVLSPFFQNFIFSSTTGAGREGLPKYNLEQFLVPIPPLKEQQRIINKIDQLIKICNVFEENIKQSTSQNEKLLQQVLREALRKEEVVNVV